MQNQFFLLYLHKKIKERRCFYEKSATIKI
nr:MAG TPA: hypothetical protein [Bacteriophage sp.]